MYFLVPAHSLSFSYLVLPIFRPSDLTERKALINSKRGKISHIIMLTTRVKLEAVMILKS
jgi:hypothetical protein